MFTKLRLGTCNNLISMAYPLNFDICAAMKKIQSFHSNSRPLKLVWSFGKSFTNATPIEAKIHWICVIIYWLDSFNWIVVKMFGKLWSTALNQMRPSSTLRRLQAPLYSVSHDYYGINEYYLWLVSMAKVTILLEHLIV